MQVVHERCAGVDVHKRTVVVTVLVSPAAGTPEKAVEKYTRTFGTMTADLLALSEWLDQLGVTQLADAGGHGVDGRIHAPHNVAKALCEWEYVVEILRIHLRTRKGNDVHRKGEPVPEGSATQGSGVADVQRIFPTPPATGGHGDV